MSTTTIGSKLRQARKDAGFTLDDVLVRVRTDLPEVMWVSRATLNRYERADQLDPFIVRYLSKVYGCTVESLGDEGTTERDRIFRSLMADDDEGTGGAMGSVRESVYAGHGAR